MAAAAATGIADIRHRQAGLIVPPAEADSLGSLVPVRRPLLLMPHQFLLVLNS